MPRQGSNLDLPHLESKIVDFAEQVAPRSAPGRRLEWTGRSAGRQEGGGGRRGDSGSRGIEWRKRREGSVHQLQQATGHWRSLDVLGIKNPRTFTTMCRSVFPWPVTAPSPGPGSRRPRLPGLPKSHLQRPKRRGSRRSSEHHHPEIMIASVTVSHLSLQT